jgi:arylsulfatase A-like enzyme
VRKLRALLGVAACLAPILTGSCVASRAGESRTNEATAATKPNVIIIMADDLGYADISAYGIQRISTPNIDRIGNDGVKFTDGYSTAPVCSPSRAATQTGRYQQRFGFEFNNGPAQRDIDQNLGIDPGEITIAAKLKESGYRTGLVGKWHLGSNESYYPTNRGYDEYVGFNSGATAYIDPSLPGVRSVRSDGAVPRPGAPIRNAASQIIEGPERTIVNNQTEYLTEYFARRATQFVGTHAPSNDPYFLYVAFNAPHDPFQVTQKYYDRFPQIESETLRIYAAMVSALDDAVGEILAAVEASGESENTIIYFLSDNGCAAYYPGLCACEPLRGGKLSHYEGGVRIPYMMRWPAQVAAGQVYRNPVSTLDIFPTLVAAANGVMPTDRVYDGVDLVPYLSGKKEGLPHDALMWRREPLVSIRAGDWKLWKDLTGSYTLLFNLAEDPNEATNLADANPEKVAELEAAIELWSQTLQDPRWPSRPPVTYDVCGTPFTLPI